MKIIEESGLRPVEDSSIVIDRVLEKKNYSSLIQLSALNSIRQLDAHKSKDSKSKLNKALLKIGINPNTISNNYAEACEQVYDNLNKMFVTLNSFLKSIDID